MAMVQRDGSGEEALNNGDSKEEVAEEEENCVETVLECAATTATTSAVTEEGDSSSSSSSGDSKTGTGEEVSAEPDETGAAKEAGPPRHQYSKAELLKLRNVDQKRPVCLDPAYNNLSGMWDPERWFSGRRRGGSVSPAEETAAPSAGSTAPPSSSSSAGGGQQRSKRERLDSEGAGGEPSGSLGGPKRRSSTDPKERLAREERDDLVLSPQRRSFGTGCHVSQPPRPSSEAGSKDDPQGLLHREPPSRRIGSGRILRDQRDWDRENRDREYGYGGRRFDDSGHSSGGGGGHSNRYDRRRGRDERIEEEEEPEWFVGGPTSQHDTIELVGFDEDPEAGSRPTRGPSSSSARRMRRNRELANRKQQNGPERRSPDQESGSKQDQQQQQHMAVTVSSSSHSSTLGTTTTTISYSVPAVAVSAVPTLKRNDSRDSSSMSANCATNVSKSSSDGPGETSTPLTTSPTLPDNVGGAPPALPTQDGFDFNDIFKPDWCPRFLSEDALGDGDVGPSGGSRFSQWFRRESPPLDQPLVPPLDSGLLAALSGKADDEGMDHHHHRHHRQSYQRPENDLASRILASAGVTSSDGMLPTSDSYFTPISPALPPDRMSPSPPVRDGNSKNILDILMDANINVEAHMLNGDAAKTARLREHALSGKAKSVEELEADLKQVVLGGHTRSVQQQQHHHHHHHHHHEQLQQQQSQQQQLHHPLGIVPTLNLPQQQDQQHLQGLLSKLGAHPGAHGGALMVPPSLPERALQEEDLLRATGQGPLPQPLQQHHGMVRGSGVDGIQQPPPGLLSQLLRPPAAAAKGPTIASQQQGGQDVLVKILAGMGPVSPGLQPPPMASHQPMSPTAQLLAARHDPMAAAAAAAMLRQQQQQEMLNSLLKPPPPVVTTQRPSPTQQLGLLAPCPSPLPCGPQDPRRVPSPLVFGQHPSPIPPVAGPAPGAPVQSSNTLQVHSGGLRPRVPSPQELAVHTQSILQTALLKKILEDQKQKENLRKQQEAQRTRSPTTTQGLTTNRGSSPSKGLSPTMAAFTPTSVMRKMHMERQDPKASDKGGTKANGETTPSDGTSRQQQQQHRMNNGTVPRAPTIGRAIIKGNQAAQPQTSSDAKNPKLIQQHPSQQQAAGSLMRGGGEVDMMAKLFEQQQQRLLQQQRVPPPPGVLGLVRQQQQQGHPAIKLPGMMRTAAAGAMAAGGPAAPPSAAMAASRAHHAAGGLKGVAGGGSGRGPSVEMLQQALAQGLHPLAFQQFLLGGATAPPTVGPSPFAPSLHPSPAHPFVTNATGPRDAKGAGMVPSGLPGRGPAVPAAAAAAAAAAGVPPANLAKWFGSDVLYQPTLPPVPHQKALLVEEVERQQQQATAVKN